MTGIRAGLISSSGAIQPHQHLRLPAWLSTSFDHASTRPPRVSVMTRRVGVAIEPLDPFRTSLLQFLPVLPSLAVQSTLD